MTANLPRSLSTNPSLDLGIVPVQEGQRLYVAVDTYTVVRALLPSITLVQTYRHEPNECNEKGRDWSLRAQLQWRRWGCIPPFIRPLF